MNFAQVLSCSFECVCVCGGGWGRLTGRQKRAWGAGPGWRRWRPEGDGKVPGRTASGVGALWPDRPDIVLGKNPGGEEGGWRGGRGGVPPPSSATHSNLDSPFKKTTTLFSRFNLVVKTGLRGSGGVNTPVPVV